MIKVLLVDDHPVVRMGLHGMLATEDDLEVVAEAGGAAGAGAGGRLHAPDVVLMDLRMPGGDGVEATARVLAQRPATRWSCSPRTRPTPTSCGPWRRGRPATCSRTPRG